MKEPTIPLRDFIADLASCLCNIGIRKRGRPPLGSPIMKKQSFPINIPTSTLDVRKDGLHHWPKLPQKRLRCKMCAPSAFTYVSCEICDV